VRAVQARVAPRSSACAQVRALPDRAAADAMADKIRSTTGLPVEILVADLGPRGTWFRLCVGDEESVARIVARATRWTAAGGSLEPFLDPPSPREARFLVHERGFADPRRTTVTAARALLARTAAPGPLPTEPAVTPALASEPIPVVAGLPLPPPAPRPDVEGNFDVWFLGTAERPLVATTGPAPGAANATATRVVVVDADGMLLAVDPSPAPGCASCVVAEQQSPVVSRRVVGAGDVHPAPGAELLVEEETADGTRLLAVLQADGAALRRRGAVLLAQRTAGVALRGDGAVVEGDGDDEREVAVSRLELRFDGGALCGLATRAEVWGTQGDGSAGLARVDALAVAGAPGGDAAVVDYITAIDAAGDRDAASRACARVLGTKPGTLVTQLCLQRVRALLGERRLVEAVNAAGTLAEGAPSLRAAVAGPLFEAMSTLDGDPRLSAAPWDCTTTPLVADVAGLPAAQVVARARARLQERVGLADVVDSAFVTAARDFGGDTPVGQIASRWLERLRVSQPARHAAIEALLLPVPEPSSATTPAPAAASAPAASPAPAAAPANETTPPKGPR